MVFALGAGKLFKLDNGGEFEETIIGMFVCSSKHTGRAVRLTWYDIQLNALIPSSPYLLPNDLPLATSRPTSILPSPLPVKVLQAPLLV